MNENDDLGLHDLLHLATDEVPHPTLAGTALSSARRRRTRRRGTAAAVLSSAVVVAVVVATHLGGRTSVAPPPADPSVPTSTPRAVVQPTWDPDTADELPAAPAEIAPTLPDVIDPPESSPLLSDEPIGAAVAVTETDGVAQLLSTEGEWRSVPLAQRYPSLELSPDGTRLSATYFGGDAGATVVDLATGASRALPLPAGYEPFDGTFWTFVDESTMFLHAGSGSGYLVDATTGAAEPVDHDAAGFDDAGVALESDCCVGPHVLVDWTDDPPRTIRLGALGRLTSLHADAHTVAANSDLGVTVADRQTLTPRAVLPTVDRTETYGDGGEPFVLALADDGTVLLRVDDSLGGGESQFRVVAWDPDTAALSVVSLSPSGVGFAKGLLGTVGQPVADPDAGAAPWDPRDVDDLPVASDDVAPLMPDVVDPPSTAPRLTEEPVSALLLAVERDDVALVLSTEGEWRSVPLPGRYSHVALSPRGTRLVVESAEHDVVVHDVGSGESHPLEPPAAFEPWDYTRWAWLDEETLLLDDAGGGWRVSAAAGEAIEVPYPTQFAWAVDPDGWVVESAEFGSPNDFTDWAGGEPRTVTTPGTGRLQSLRAGTETVGGTSYDDRTFSLIVADRGSLSPTHVLPVNDHEGNYSGGGLGVIALGDDGTVFLRVADYDRPFSSRVVAWEPTTGTLARVSTVNTGLRVVRYAEGLIGRDAP